MQAALALLLCLAPALQAAEDRGFAWDESRPKFRTSEYVLTGLAVAGSAANYFWVSPPQSPVWKGDILFDKSARNALGKDPRSQRRSSDPHPVSLGEKPDISMNRTRPASDSEACFIN